MEREKGFYMILNKDQWKYKDIADFQKYLKTFENKDIKKKEWCKNLLNTTMPVLALKTNTIKDIVKAILKGNYLTFLDLMIWEYYENTAINGFLITKIADFDLMKKYLDIYSERADNWATCDLLAFDVKNNEEKFLNLSLEYIKSQKPFKRRIGIEPLLMLVKKEEFVDAILHILDKFENEEEYYVNMMNAWLLCECFIRHREKTLAYFEKNKLNKFTINKAISKCRDSFRVSKEDKNTLLKFKR